MMKLKVNDVFQATLTISQIIRENRPMPQKGKYRLARMHAKLLPEFTMISEQRDALIKAYDHHPEIYGPDGVSRPADEFSVPADKMQEFNAAWKEIGDQEIEVDVEPIPLDQLDLGSANGSVTASELVTLGELVRE